MILGIDYAGVDGGAITPAQTGAKFAYVRASGSLSTDTTWAKDRGRWAAASIPAGAYHWFNFHADPVAQANVFIESAGERKTGELPPALDLEADSAEALHLTPQECLDRAEKCLTAILTHYHQAVIYTSARVWADVFGNLPSGLMGGCPLWLKIPYAYKARNPPHFDAIPAYRYVPLPWQSMTSAGLWMVQFQGDAIGLPGTTSTVDLNEFLPLGNISSWTSHLLHASDIRAFQQTHSLVADGVIGPKTFAALVR